MTVLRPRLSLALGLAAVLTITLGVAPSVDQPSPPGAEAGFHPMQQMHFLKKMKPDVERIGVIWKKGADNQEQKLERLKRAVASIQGKLFVAYVEGKSDIGDKFRLMTREHDVQALWIVENDGVVDASAPRQFLIKNAVKEGLPLLAPSKDWVDDGAPVAIEKDGEKFRILMNEAAAEATALKVPDEYKNLVASL